jgi:16S rRNA (guanine527-N7)-methyltransferase
MEIIQKYFPELTKEQLKQFQLLGDLYTHWNEQINVISRKDVEHLYTKHVLHSLAICKFIQFEDKTKVLDVGTGGGFPGIPLAIMFPNCSFLLVDSIGKKIKVVNEVIHAIGLNNVVAEKVRAEDVTEKVDFVVSRAVTRLAPFYQWIYRKIRKRSFNSIPNGLIALKGGDLTEEIANFKAEYKSKSIKEINISDYFEDEFFLSKKIVYLKN